MRGAEEDNGNDDVFATDDADSNDGTTGCDTAVADDDDDDDDDECV